MGEFEEETYSVVFASLRHPIRRKILRVLSKGPRTFTGIQNSFNVNSPVLTYHLEALKDLISKTEDGKYRLSVTGEGAIALMERVEEAPQTMPRTVSSPRRRRALSLLQLTATILAITLFISGWYLASISTTQDSYTLPFEYSSRKIPTTVDGVVYNTYITIRAPPTKELVINRVDRISVRIKNAENVSLGICNVTLRYLEYSPVEDKYIPKELNYTAGQFMPAETSDGLIFSGFMTLPASIGLGISEQPIPRDIVVTVLTNITASNPAPLFKIEAPLYGLYVERQPYRDQGFLCIAAGVIILIATLAVSIFLLIDDYRH